MNAVRWSALVVATAAPLLLSAPAEAGDASQLLPLVPSNAELVVGIDVDALRSTTVYSRVMSMLQSSSDFSATMTQLETFGGFDPTTDVHAIVIATPEVGEDSADNPVVIINATFDLEQISAGLANVQGLSSTDLGAARLWTRGSETLAAVAPSTLIFGRTSDLQGVIANGGGAGSRLSAQIDRADRSEQIWFAALSPEGEEQIVGMHGSIDLSSGLSAKVSLLHESAERAASEAERLATQRTQLLADPALAMFGLTNVVNSITSVANGETLDLSVSIDAATWNTLLTTFLAIVESEL